MVCVELEQKFVKLAEQNFALHAKKLAALNCPQSIIIQGDSRELCRIVQEADIVIASPPFLQGDKVQARSGFGPGWRKVPFGERMDKCPRDGNYGTSPGQLGAMKAGSVDAVVSSPPYEKSMDSIEDAEARAARADGFQQGQKNLRYGQNPNTFLSKDPSGLSNQQRHEIAAQNPQIGQLQGETFWSAARDIVAQCYQILKDGGVAIWVVKAFIRKGRIVDFPGDWRRLCESVGFQTLHEHHAMLFKEERFTALWGEELIDRTDRNSFFRTLCNNKAGWRAYWEIVPVDEQTYWLTTALTQLPSNKPGHIVLVKAQGLAFKDTAERIYDWNEDVRIDYEVVLCQQKQK